MQTPRRWMLLAAVVIAVCALTFQSSLIVSSQSQPPVGKSKTKSRPAAGVENFDIRAGQASQKSSELATKAGATKSVELTLETLKPQTASPTTCTAPTPCPLPAGS